MNIDLNADLGEGAINDSQLLGIVTSCNIACGGHAGDSASMRSTVTAALGNGVVIGAHPSYPDRAGFGRRSRFSAGSELRLSLQGQIASLRDICIASGTTLRHVKPHGALYNDAMRDRDLAELLIEAIAGAVPGAAAIGLPASALAIAADEHNLPFIREGFIDRAYRPDGQLLPRTEAGAVHTDLDIIVNQALNLVGRVDTLCIHSDTEGAVAAATAVRQALQDNGVTVHAIGG
jgi:5-oxoprolinase (ATP-hydrolysing) subunit A